MYYYVYIEQKTYSIDIILNLFLLLITYSYLT